MCEITPASQQRQRNTSPPSHLTPEGWWHCPRHGWELQQEGTIPGQGEAATLPLPASAGVLVSGVPARLLAGGQSWETPTPFAGGQVWEGKTWCVQGSGSSGSGITPSSFISSPFLPASCCPAQRSPPLPPPPLPAARRNLQVRCPFFYSILVVKVF